MLLIKMLLNGNSTAVVKYISVIIPTIKLILTIPTSTKNRNFHDLVLSMYTVSFRTPLTFN